LTYTYICSKEGRNKIVPNILYLSVDSIIRKEIGNSGIESCFVQYQRKKTMVKRREKLSYIQSSSTCV